ncbi:MAG TPA: bifunctional nicotinamidase/pyrazinamidase [Thermoanaerobaculia bacterium]|nr:bifunctional nicotinamidase/pyrazinamidase [Thermoanaerobaculia bacterium]
MTKALIMVDIQNDFMPGGALPTREGDAIVEVVNRLQPHFPLVFATQDWHPQNHGSFASNHPGKTPGEVIDLGGIQQVLWPDHCVQETQGAEFHPDLDVDRIEAVIRKGTDPAIDSYSGFFDNAHRKATGLEEQLRSRDVTDVCVVGLATDYCVRFTTLDALALGFKVAVVRDACRGVELQDGDIESAFEEMRTTGAEIVGSSQIG